MGDKKKQLSDIEFMPQLINLEFKLVLANMGLLTAVKKSCDTVSDNILAPSPDVIDMIYI